MRYCSEDFKDKGVFVTWCGVGWEEFLGVECVDIGNFVDGVLLVIKGIVSK